MIHTGDDLQSWRAQIDIVPGVMSSGLEYWNVGTDDFAIVVYGYDG